MSPKYETVTFRPDLDILELLDNCVRTTGKKRSEIINEALGEVLPKLFTGTIVDQRNMQQRFLKDWAGYSLNDSVENPKEIEKNLRESLAKRQAQRKLESNSQDRASSSSRKN